MSVAAELRRLLLESPEVTELVGENVFWPHLPTDFRDWPAITVSEVGGAEDFVEVPWSAQRYQIRAWGRPASATETGEPDAVQARAIHDAVFNALVMLDDIGLRSPSIIRVQKVGGPIRARDPFSDIITVYGIYACTAVRE
jgi:hypothetical protein